MKATLIVAALVIVAGGALLLKSTTSSGATNASEDALFAVARGPLTVTITENGSLMAKNSQNVVFESDRSGKITYLIEQGKEVEEGELLCKLDTTQLESQIQESELMVLQTTADRDSAQTEYEIQETDNKATIEKAQVTLERAKKELEKYGEGDAPKERRNLEIQITEAQTELSQAKKRYEDSQELIKKNYINKAQLEQDQIAYERAKIKLEGAQKDKELFETYTYPMTLLEKQIAVNDAERERANADKRAESRLRQRQVAVESYERRLKRIKDELEKTKEQLEKCTIHSPCPGIVIYGDPKFYWTVRQIKVGNEVWGGFTLFTIPDLRVMQVQLSVHEADISKIALEQSATITMDTYPGLVLKGKVTKIANIANDDGNGGDGVKRFTVDVTLDSTEGVALRPGVSAKTEIFVEALPEVLYVPVQCVFSEEGVFYCYVMNDGGQPVKTEVKTGSANDTYIQIAEGLAEGQRVLLYNPSIGVESETQPEKKPETNGAAAPLARVQQ